MIAALVSTMVAACGGGSDDQSSALPQLSAASSANLAGTCDALAAKLAFANTTFASVKDVPAGTLAIAGKAVPEHCVIEGTMNQRVSAVDGKTYAIGFEMRLPLAWNGRFFYQANGGLDGNIVPATGVISGGGPLNNALNMGFAVISSDAGHSSSQNPLFGLDPQARLDYGYQAVAKLTPMAKQVIKTAYGKGPDRSYFEGCSNGGRHAMVAGARNAADYDGIIAGDPGVHLPKAAIGEMWVRYANTVLKRKVPFASDFPLITPDRWIVDFQTAGFRPDIQPLIMKKNAVDLLRLAQTEF